MVTPSIARPFVTAPRTSFEPIHSVTNVGASETACWSWVPLAAEDERRGARRWCG